MLRTNERHFLHEVVLDLRHPNLDLHEKRFLKTVPNGNDTRIQKTSGYNFSNKFLIEIDFKISFPWWYLI